LPTGEKTFNVYHEECNKEVAKLNNLLLGKSYASDNYLFNNLSDIYKKHSNYHNLKPSMLWRIGRLNFRLHNFDEAKLFLNEATKLISDHEKFPVYALLAYACEYSGHPSEAIEVLLGKTNPIFDLPFCTKSGIRKDPSHTGYCSNYCNSEEVPCKYKTNEEGLFKELSELFVSDKIEDVKKNIFLFIKKSTSKELFSFYSDYLPQDASDKCNNCKLNYTISTDCESKKSGLCYKMQNNELDEVIHILAHSISEYSSKILDDKINGEKVCSDNYHNFRIKMYLHNLAYRLMDVLDDYPFVCCKSMLKAEAGLVQDALEIINERNVQRPEGIDDDEWEGFGAEQAFFRWYFSQLFNKPMLEDQNKETPKDIFIKYAKKVEAIDKDAQMHSTLMNLRSCIRDFRMAQGYGKQNEHYEELKEKYEELLNHPFSEYVNREIRIEYDKFKCIAEILLSYDPIPNKNKVFDRILNFAYPFLEAGEKKIELLKDFIEKSCVFKPYYFIFPVQYTGSLEYQMADIEDLIVHEEDIYNLSNKEELVFNTKLPKGFNSQFKEIEIINDTHLKKDKIIFVLYYEAGQCFEFSKKIDDKFLPQKGFPLSEPVWQELIKAEYNELFHIFQYSNSIDENKIYCKNDYVPGNAQVAIIITIDNTELSGVTEEFEICLKAVKGINPQLKDSQKTKNKYLDK